MQIYNPTIKLKLTHS